MFDSSHLYVIILHVTLFSQDLERDLRHSQKVHLEEIDQSLLEARTQYQDEVTKLRNQNTARVTQLENELSQVK